MLKKIDGKEKTNYTYQIYLYVYKKPHLDNVAMCYRNKDHNIHFSKNIKQEGSKSGITSSIRAIRKMNMRSSMDSKPINIRWIRTCTQPYCTSCIASKYRQLSINIEIKILELLHVLLARV